MISTVSPMQMAMCESVAKDVITLYALDQQVGGSVTYLETENIIYLVTFRLHLML
jgi:hypothetical protein